MATVYRALTVQLRVQPRKLSVKKDAEWREYRGPMVRKYPRNEWLRNNCVKNTSLGRKSSVKLLNSVPFNMQGHGIAVGRRTLLEDCYIFIQNLFSFSRPHTIFGTLISVFSMSLMARSEGRSLALGKSLVLAALCAVAMNVSIVGLNQVYDKQIDKINKPYLPLASGHFATDTALTVISATCSFAFILGVASSSFHLLFTLLMSLVLGIVYSSDMKLLRWKRVPILATVCILSVRAFLVQWGFLWSLCKFIERWYLQGNSEQLMVLHRIYGCLLDCHFFVEGRSRPSWGFAVWYSDTDCQAWGGTYFEHMHVFAMFGLPGWYLCRFVSL